MSPDDYRAGLHAWINRASSVPGCLRRDGIQLKLHGKTFKSVGLSYYGSDPGDPSSVTLELKESSVKPDGVGYDFDNPDTRFILRDDEIDVLRSFFNGNFTEDGYYVRADSPEMASEIKRQLSGFSPETLADVLSAVSDKLDLVRAIENTGHANFLAYYVTNERKRKAIDELEAAALDSTSDEARFQTIIEKNPWLFGGQYVAARSERTIVLGDHFDVPLVSADGSLHIIELKKANISPLIRKQRNHLMVGGAVHEAVSQTQNYLRSVDEDRNRIGMEFDLDARRVFATVVIGHIAHHNNPEITATDVYQTLRTYNSHLTRIQVMTYDQLIDSARNALTMSGSDDGGDESGNATPPDPQPDGPDDPFGPTGGIDPFGPPSPTDPFGPIDTSSGFINPDDEPPF